MSSTKSRTETGLLEARDGRERELRRALARTAGGSILMVSANVPGPAKHRQGLARRTFGALDALRDDLGLEVLLSAYDALGPFHLAHSPAPPAQAKRVAVALETREPCGRILDVDVYGPGGDQVDRAALGLPPRPCLICAEPAAECMRLGRHPGPELLARTDALLRMGSEAPLSLRPDLLALALHEGALAELALTPKPGLVDRHDRGSHPDLSFEAMTISADLLPLYYEELLQCSGQGRPLEASVRAGLEAEARMVSTIHSNGHRGFIFLSGMVLLAACEAKGSLSGLRPALSRLASLFFEGHPAPDTPGARIRADLGLGGIRLEVEQGLPAVFDHGWPAYRDALAKGWDIQRAGFLLMAVLMQRVEDTTAVRRCGLPGLARLREDGVRLERLLHRGEAPEGFLAGRNDAYRKMNLTMGGVADCMALTFALHRAAW